MFCSLCHFCVISWLYWLFLSGIQAVDADRCLYQSSGQSWVYDPCAGRRQSLVLNYSQEALNRIVARSTLHFTDPQQVVQASLSLPRGSASLEPLQHTRISLFFNSQSKDSISFIQCSQSWALLKFINVGGWISLVWKGDKNGECKQVFILVLFFQNLVGMILATLQCCAVKPSNREWCNTRHVQNLLEWLTKLLR